MFLVPPLVINYLGRVDDLSFSFFDRIESDAFSPHHLKDAWFNVFGILILGRFVLRPSVLQIGYRERGEVKIIDYCG